MHGASGSSNELKYAKETGNALSKVINDGKAAAKRLETAWLGVNPPDTHLTQGFKDLEQENNAINQDIQKTDESSKKLQQLREDVTKLFKEKNNLPDSEFAQRLEAIKKRTDDLHKEIG